MHPFRLFCLTLLVALAASAAWPGAGFLLPDALGGGADPPRPAAEKGFQKNQISAGFAVGAGWGTRVLGTEENHHLAEAVIHAGWVFSDVQAPGRWYAGNWEILAELFGGSQVHPRYRYLAGFTPLLRYTFARRPWAPFLEAGAGVSATDINGPDLSKVFQFNLQGGGGVHYFFREETALTVEYRWLHLSNAGMTEINNGTNTQMLLLGVNWYF